MAKIELSLKSGSIIYAPPLFYAGIKLVLQKKNILCMYVLPTVMFQIAGL